MAKKEVAKKNDEITMENFIANNEDSLFKGLLKLVQNTEATGFIVNTLKNSIPNLTGGMIEPKDMYFDEKKNSLNISFDIKPSDNEEKYNIELVILKKDYTCRYELHISNGATKYSVSFEEMKKYEGDY